MTDPQQRFLDVVVRHLLVDSPAEIPPDATLRTLGLNSMRAVDLVIDLEEEFGLTIPDEAFNDETFATVSSLWDVVGGLLPARVAT